MLKWFNSLFSKTKTEDNTDYMKLEVPEHQKTTSKA